MEGQHPSEERSVEAEVVQGGCNSCGYGVRAIDVLKQWKAVREEGTRGALLQNLRTCE